MIEAIFILDSWHNFQSLSVITLPWINLMNSALKETDDSRADGDHRHDRRRFSEGGPPLDGDADRFFFRLQHGVQAGQDQEHCGHYSDGAGMYDRH